MIRRLPGHEQAQTTAHYALLPGLFVLLWCTGYLVVGGGIRVGGVPDARAE